MASTVYFLKVDEDTPQEKVIEGLNKILTKEDICASFSSGGLTGIKMHFGEAEDPNTVDPVYIRTIVDAVKEQGSNPFLTDTNTLYRGKRSNSVDHINLASSHSYSIEGVGAPVVILDGLAGKNFMEVPLENGKHCKTAKIAKDVLSIDDLIVVTHVTGHGGAGLGGSIKNVGMGMASRGGKQIQHSGILPNRSSIQASCPL
jgi:uncharacterized Fe-S center protein